MSLIGQARKAPPRQLRSVQLLACRVNNYLTAVAGLTLDGEGRGLWPTRRTWSLAFGAWELIPVPRPHFPGCSQVLEGKAWAIPLSRCMVQRETEGQGPIKTQRKWPRVKAVG